jgi:mono/diheme cytochrome c family protein
MNFLRRNCPTSVIPAQAGIQGLRVALAGLFSLLALSPMAAMAADDIEIGRRIYVDGVLSSGAPLAGERFDAKELVTGAKAACVTCHRPSGMGSVEGDLLVSPINGTYLYNLSQKGRAVMDPHVGKLLSQAHDAYTDATLSQTIRSGINNAGREMNVAMPHYALNDKDMAALIAYLKQLSPQWSPGVTADRIRLATVIAPGVSAERRKVFVDMMRTAVTQKNGATAQGKHHMTSAAEMLLRTERKWDLDNWELQGAPESWAAQLDAYSRKQPAFALVSGLGEGTWQPVHDFCERQQMPCWFPSVDLPPTKSQDFYTLYFSRGVALEADLLAQALRAENAQRPKRLLQIFHDDAVGAGGVQALTHALEGAGLVFEQRRLGDVSADALRTALQGVGATDAVMFWLNPADLAALAGVTPPAAAGLYFSTELARGEHGFPPAWKAAARLVYPYELPDKRPHNLAYLQAWLKSRGIPLIDEAMQSEVYFALTFLTDSFAEMLDNFYRDYLIERAENMISRRESSRAEEEANVRPHLGARAPYAGNRPVGTPSPMAAQPTNVAVIGHSQSTTIYPRLALAPGQRFASKGGYIVRFADSGSDKLVAETDWMVP